MKRKQNLRITIFIAAVVLAAACSSQPKTKGDVLTLRNQAEAGLDQGNREAGRGNYENAHRFITESKKNAILCDDLSLIIRSCLSLGNLYLYTGMEEDAYREWNQAVAEAQKLGNAELLAASKIFLARGRFEFNKNLAGSVLEEIRQQHSSLKTHRLYIAYSFQAQGLALRELGNYSEAENAFKNSLEIHEKDMYLENASYDWYVIASIRSLNGNLTGAIDALESSIAVDRRIENSWGLASSYRAMGEVYSRMGNSASSEEAFLKAISIYEAMKNTEAAAELREKLL